MTGNEIAKEVLATPVYPACDGCGDEGSYMNPRKLGMTYAYEAILCSDCANAWEEFALSAADPLKDRRLSEINVGLKVLEFVGPSGAPDAAETYKALLRESSEIDRALYGLAKAWVLARRQASEI